MTTEGIKELVGIKDTNDITSHQVVVWAKRVKAQRLERAILRSIRDTEQFDTVGK